MVPDADGVVGLHCKVVLQHGNQPIAMGQSRAVQSSVSLLVLPVQRVLLVKVSRNNALGSHMFMHIA